jgi:hypothetical protein
MTAFFTLVSDLSELEEPMSNPRHTRHVRHPGPLRQRADTRGASSPRPGPEEESTSATHIGERPDAGRSAQIEAARAWARERCSPRTVELWRTCPRGTGPGFEALWFALGIKWIFPEGLEGGVYEITEQAGRYFFRNARTCADTFDLAMTVAKHNIYWGGELPIFLKALVMLRIDGRLERPKSRGRSRTKNWERDAYVFKAIEDLVAEFGVRPTRNDVTTAADSACDLVSKAFKEAGEHTLTYKAVKAIWLNKTLRRQIEVVRDFTQARRKADTFEPLFVQVGAPLSAVFGK